MVSSRRFFFLIPAILFGVASCNDSASLSQPESMTPLPDVSMEDPSNPLTPIATTTPTPTPSSSTPAPSDETPSKPSYTTAVLLFNGTGVSTSDWQTTETIIKNAGLSYQLVNSTQLDAMSLEQLKDFGVIVVPGGSGGTIAGSVSTASRLKLRQAVRDHGVGYVGFCAGAWVGVGPEAETNSTASYGFAIAKGSILDLFQPGGANPTAAIVPVTFANGDLRSLVWWGGPITPEWKEGVVARYDTGVPAISQTYSGKGLVLVSGPHPEAPQGWRATAGNDPDGLDYDIAIALIEAALNKKPLPTYQGR